MTLIKRLPRNTAGRDFLIGDIHGMFDQVEELLAAVNFDRKVDRLIAVGDLVDRGPDSDQVLEWLDRPWFHSVTGNHEVMAIEALMIDSCRLGYRMNGGGWLLSLMPHEQADYLEAFQRLPIVIEFETAAGKIGVVHADVPGSNWARFIASLESPENMASGETAMNAVWSRARFDAHRAGYPTTRIEGIDYVVTGHTPVKEPLWLENLVDIDTGACFGGNLTLLDASTMKPAAAVRGRKDRQLQWEE